MQLTTTNTARTPLLDNPHRRRFIRTSAGGLIAAALPMTGCSPIAAVPDSAIAAWQLEELPDEPRHWMLAHAILAPNPHNRQPWLVDLSEANVINVSIDTERLLPHTDPFGRQIMIGTGAMLGLLEIAAAERGYTATMQYIGPSNTDRLPTKEPLIRVELAKRTEPSTQHAELFKQIQHRHTERANYQPNKPLPVDFYAQLDDLAIPQQSIHTVSTAQQAGDHQAISQLIKQAWHIELSTPHTMMESMELLRVGSKEIDHHRDGISIDSPFLVMLDKLGLFDRSKPPAVDSRVFNQQIDEFNQAIDSTPSFLVLSSIDNSRWAQIQAGVSYVKAQLLATQYGLSMHPVSQGIQEYAEMTDVYTNLHNILNTRAGTTGNTVQMLTRIGYIADPAERTGASPRRGLSEHITT